MAQTCQCSAQGKDAARPRDKRRCCSVGRCCRSVLSTRTASDIRAALRAALSHAQSQDLIVKNPATSVTLATVRRRRGKAGSSDEARKFLEAARRDRDPLYAAYVQVLVLGLRKGEALGLTWDDTDLDDGNRVLADSCNGSVGNSYTATPNLKRRRPSYRYRTAVSAPCGYAKRSRPKLDQLLARRGRSPTSSSPLATAHRSSPGTSGAPGSSVATD